MHHAKMPAGHLVFIFVTRSHKKQCGILIPRDAPVGHRRGNNPVEYVFFRVMPLWGIDAVTIRLSMFFFFFRVMPLWGIDAVTIRLSMFFFLFLFPRDAPVGRRGNNPVEFVFFIFIFLFLFVTRSHKKQCGILIEV